MTDVHIYSSQLPDDTIAVVPRSLEYLYDRDDRVGDVIEVLLDDKRVGSVVVVLNESMARHVVAHLSAMLDDLPRLRKLKGN